VDIWRCRQGWGGIGAGAPPRTAKLSRQPAVNCVAASIAAASDGLPNQSIRLSNINARTATNKQIIVENTMTIKSINVKSPIYLFV
jgi:hypothetical protein